jgi:Pentapeptide repeats (8 copies)
MPAPEPIPDLLKAVNEASGKAFALWITFLTVGTYLAIAIGTTTHLQLLLAGPVKLPLLGVDLPLFAFYGFTPPMFVVLHLYVLMQLYLLARLLRLFDDDLRAADMIEQDRRRVRGQLDKFVFTQFLIGVPQDRIVRLFLRVVVWLSFVIGPVLLLLGFQLRFLPYHSALVTNMQRATLLLDLTLLALLWPRISRSGRPALHDRQGTFARLVTNGGLALLALSFLLAAVFGFLEPVAPNSLSLGGERLVEPDEDKLSKLARTLPLRGRELRQANLSGSDLRKADLRSANLSGADLSLANLSGADLTFAYLGGANLSGAHLNAAHLSGANLSGADLTFADLSGADLTFADLHSVGAHLIVADVRGANLSGSDAILYVAGLTQEQLDQACGTDAKLPPGLTLKPCPPK